MGALALKCAVEAKRVRNGGSGGFDENGTRNLRELPRLPLHSPDRPNAWTCRRYRRGDLARNACEVNSPSSTVVEGGASPAPVVQTGQQTSGLWNGEPTGRNSASRVGSGPARARPEWQRTPRSNTELGPAASVLGPFSKTGLLRR